MVPNSSTTSLLNSIKAIELLKNLILDQLRAVYGHQYPTSHYTFSVVTCRVNQGSRKHPDVEYHADAIVYTKPGSLAEWRLLTDCQEAQPTTLEAMESLYHVVQAQAFDIIIRLSEGDVWNEETAKELEEDTANAA